MPRRHSSQASPVPAPESRSRISPGQGGGARKAGRGNREAVAGERCLPASSTGGRRMTTAFEITLFEKSDGPLTKTIRLNGSGIVADGSDCRMSRGVARRTPVASVEEFAERTANLAQNQAWVMGALRDGLPDEVRVITKDKLGQRTQPSVSIIARTGDYLVFRPGRPALLPIDFDSKGMPPAVAEKVKGGWIGAVATGRPDVATTARGIRRSTSARLRRTDTREEWPRGNPPHLL